MTGCNRTECALHPIVTWSTRKRKPVKPLATVSLGLTAPLRCAIVVRCYVYIAQNNERGLECVTYAFNAGLYIVSISACIGGICALWILWTEDSWMVAFICYCRKYRYSYS